MIVTPGQIRKGILQVILAMVLIAGIGYSILVFTEDLAHSQPIEGIQIFIPDKDICSIAPGDGVIWAGGTDGLYKLTRTDSNNGLSGSKATYTMERVGNYQYIRAVLLDGDNVWIGHDSGLTLIENGTVTDFTEKEGLPDMRVNALCLDSEGDLWVGTWGGVVVLQKDRIVRTMTREDGLPDDMINVILQDSQGGMWFGSYVAPRGGVSVLHQGEWQLFTTKDALVHSNINTIIELSNGDVMVGGGLYTQGGGTRFSFRDGQWEKSSTIKKEDGLAGAKIRSMLEDSKGRLWIGSEYEGLAILLDGASTIMTTENGLSNDEVKAIVEEPDGTIWIGTREGLVRIDKGRMENVR